MTFKWHSRGVIDDKTSMPNPGHIGCTYISRFNLCDTKDSCAWGLLSISFDNLCISLHESKRNQITFFGVVDTSYNWIN